MPLYPPSLGSQGRSLTRLDPSGQVEIDGSVFQAETSMFGADPRRAPIPPDRVVLVSGWRMDNERRVVLLVTDPTAPAPGQGDVATGVVEAPGPPKPPPTPEERIQTLERQLQSVLHTLDRIRASTPVAPVSEEDERWIGWLLLTFGQIVSVLICLIVPCYVLIALSQAAEIRQRAPDAPNATRIVLGGILVFLYSAAMFVVFSRCKSVRDD